MDWDEKTQAAVDLALNEADVLGIRLEPGGAWCDLMLHVLALPQVGPIDSDARRILRLTSPAQLSLALRADHAETPSGYGPVIPLASLDAAEDFFASLSWSGSMYGWTFLDRSLPRDWPAQPSLAMQVRPGTGPHSLYWFNECGRPEDGREVAYCLEGTITFDDLQVLRAGPAPLPLDQFTADARRYWSGLHDRDERLSSAAQRTAQDGTPSWRSFLRPGYNDQ